MKVAQELGPLTRAEKAELRVEELEAKLDGQHGEIEALDHQRKKDNEYLLEEQGKLRCEIDRLAPFETMSFDLGSELKCLVTALCPILSVAHSNDIRDWDALFDAYESAREHLGMK